MTGWAGFRPARIDEIAKRRLEVEEEEVTDG